MALTIRALRTALLAPVNLDIADGEAVSVRGPSGSGKTMLLRTIVDLDVNEGEVFLDGQPRSRMSGPAWRRLVRYVAAEPGWWGQSVGEHFRNVLAAAATAKRLGLPDDCMTWEIARLSSGEKQRLAFLRGLEGEPRVLLLDEPTAALDEKAARAVESMIRGLLRQGVSMLLVTHDEAQAKRLADRHFEMENRALRPWNP